ncbi:ATP-binding protein [Oleiharenicola lentus]|uniref:hybrid sensor histidine kinase/response regulator n=1 Tax=Oleiharenicola lentus TaxID=2508720 RepID=UPI003F67D83A
MIAMITNQLIIQQDYFWFLAALVMAGVGFAAFRPWDDSPRQAWLGWVALGQCLISIIELVRLSQPVKMNPYAPVNLEVDLCFGVILALQAWAVLPADRRWCKWMLPVLMLLAWLRKDFPWLATSAMNVVITAGLAWRVMIAREAVDRRVGLILAAIVWFSPIGLATTLLHTVVNDVFSAALLANAPPSGPLHYWTAGLRRWSTTGIWGAWASFGMFLGGAVILSELMRRRPVVTREQREWRRIFPLAALWLVAGLFLTAWVGSNARELDEKFRLGQVRLAASLIDPKDFTAAFGTLFDPQRVVSSDTSKFIKATVSPEFQAAVLPVREQMATIEKAVSGEPNVLIQVARNGWNFNAAFPGGKKYSPKFVTVLGPSEETVSWAPVFLEPYQAAYGVVIQARAPLKFSTGVLGGWLALEWDMEQWLASQAQARLQAFVIVALGLGLALLSVVQRVKGWARDEALRAAETARNADRTKTEFLARVSHELRTPLQSVLSYKEVLQTSIQGEEGQSHLRTLHHHGELMLRLVNDLLDLPALQTGNFQIAARPTQVAELIRQTAESLRPQAEAKGLAFHVSIEVPSDRWCLADGERVRQVLINLTGNAIKFTDRGEVRVRLQAESDEGFLLRVSDSGPGIGPEEAKRLFKPFARLEKTRAKEGSGLGLALVAGLCEAMGGRVSLGEATAGASFEARFKLAPAQPPPSDLVASGSLALLGKRVLIVDDNTLVRDLFGTYLTALGAQCQVTGNGGEAIARAAGQSFDAVILDYELPGMDGAAIAQVLREQNKGARSRIIGASAHAGEAERIRAMASGMDEFLIKPVDLRQLARAVEQPPIALVRGRSNLEELIERLRVTFQAEAPHLEAAFARALSESDWLTLQAKAHYLKNSADVLALSELSAACQALAEPALQGDPVRTRAVAATCMAHLRAWN